MCEVTEFGNSDNAKLYEAGGGEHFIDPLSSLRQAKLQEVQHFSKHRQAQCFGKVFVTDISVYRVVLSCLNLVLGNTLSNYFNQGGKETQLNKIQLV
jgi:hypothetical protein